jgi:hypothetical protein
VKCAITSDHTLNNDSASQSRLSGSLRIQGFTSLDDYWRGNAPTNPKDAIIRCRARVSCAAGQTKDQKYSEYEAVCQWAFSVELMSTKVTTGCYLQSRTMCPTLSHVSRLFYSL